MKSQGLISDTRKFRERFGVLPKSIKQSKLLIHCASLGEVNACSQLINALIDQHGEGEITLTSSSVTGALRAEVLFKDRVQHCFLPFDLWPFLALMLNRVAPKQVLITEVEYWPNFIDLLFYRGVEVHIVNARMSSKSLPTYLRFGTLYKHTLRKCSTICAQSQESFDNFLRLGVFKSQLFLTRNMKFDLQVDIDDERKATDLRRQFMLAETGIMLGASTHAPEEQILLNAFQDLRKSHPELVLIIVPRHPHRFEEVYTMIKATGFSYQRLSEVKDNNQQSKADIILIDAMGFLKAAYQVCSFAFVGGSLVEKGGHNPLECAIYAKPCLMGPSIFNNPEIIQLLHAKGGLAFCQSEQGLFVQASQLLKDPEETQAKGALALSVIQENAGAVKATLNVLNKTTD